MRLNIALKNRVATHRNRVKNFEGLVFNDVVEDNVKHILAGHFHRMTQNKIHKGWFKVGDWDQHNADMLSCSAMIKHAEPLPVPLKKCWLNYPNLKGAQEKCPNGGQSYVQHWKKSIMKS